MLDSLEFDPLKWSESAGAFMGLPNLANEALNALTFQVTTTEPSFVHQKLGKMGKNGGKLTGHQESNKSGQIEEIGPSFRGGGGVCTTPQ